MLGTFLQYLHVVLPPMLFACCIAVMLIAIFKKAEWGLLLLAVLIPQPNIWFKFMDYFTGTYLLNYIFLAIVFGIFLQKKGYVKSENSTWIMLFVLYSYFALWNSSLRYSLALPFTTDNILLKPWKNYIMMILMYFLALNVVKGEKQQKLLVVVMALVVLFLAWRSLRSFTAGDAFSYDSRVDGPFEIVGLGSNHYAAFIVYCAAQILGLYFYEDSKKIKMLFLTTVLLCLHPLFFTFSRGAYLAAVAVLGLFGILKKRSLLIGLVALIICWQTVLPPSVVDRIEMTETTNGNLEHSAAVRLVLWDTAIHMFQRSPILGSGFSSFKLAMQGETYTDTHNFFIKTIVEEGILGAVLLLVLLLKSLHSGFTLWKIGRTPFHRGLGFGFLGCICAVIVTNVFGDRWSYIEIGTYFWVFWGLVDRGLLITKTALSEETESVNTNEVGELIGHEVAV